MEQKRKGDKKKKKPKTTKKKREVEAEHDEKEEEEEEEEVEAVVVVESEEEISENTTFKDQGYVNYNNEEQEQEEEETVIMVGSKEDIEEKQKSSSESESESNSDNDSSSSSDESEEEEQEKEREEEEKEDEDRVERQKMRTEIERLRRENEELQRAKENHDRASARVMVPVEEIVKRKAFIAAQKSLVCQRFTFFAPSFSFDISEPAVLEAKLFRRFVSLIWLHAVSGTVLLFNGVIALTSLSWAAQFRKNDLVFAALYDLCARLQRSARGGRGVSQFGHEGVHGDGWARTFAGRAIQGSMIQTASPSFSMSGRGCGAQRTLKWSTWPLGFGRSEPCLMRWACAGEAL